MANKTLFCSSYVVFCTFCASLRLKRTVFTRPKTSIISVNPVILSDIFRVLRVLRGKKIREISVNSWLINDLRAYNALYNCKETFTDVMKTLQIKLFLQNKAKFQKVKLNVTKVLTRDYDQMDTWSIRKKQSQTKPNKAKLKKARMNVTSYITKGYENKPPIGARKNKAKLRNDKKQCKLFYRKGL